MFCWCEWGISPLKRLQRAFTEFVYGALVGCTKKPISRNVGGYIAKIYFSRLLTLLKFFRIFQVFGKIFEIGGSGIMKVRHDTLLPGFLIALFLLASIYSRNDAGNSFLISQRRSWATFHVGNWQENPIIWYF